MGAAVGLLGGLLLVQMFQLGYLLSLLVIGAVVLMLASLDTYRAWLLLLLAANINIFRFVVSDFTIRPEQIVFMALILGLAMSFLIGKIRFYRVPMLLPLFLYLTANFVASALYSPDKAESYKGSTLLVIYGMMYIGTVLVLNTHSDKLKNAIKILMVFAGIHAAFSILALALHAAGLDIGFVMRPISESSASWRTSGGFEEANLLGAFTAAMGLMFIAFLTSKESAADSHRKLIFITLVVILAAMILTYTRAAWIGFGIGMFMLLFMQKPPGNIFNPKTMTMLILSVMVLPVMLLPVLQAYAPALLNDTQNRMSEILDFSSSSGEGRVEVQKVALDRWRGSIMLGKGTLSLPPEAARPAPPGSWLYSSLIQAIHDTGIVGLLLYLWFQVGVLAVILRGYLLSRDPFLRSALAGFAAGGIALLIASQASSFIWLGFPWIFSGLGVAVAASEIKKHRAGCRRLHELNRP